MGADQNDDKGSTEDIKQPGTEDATGREDQDAEAKKKADDDNAGIKKALNSERKLREAAEKKVKEFEMSSLPELDRFKTMNGELSAENEKLKAENQKQRIALELGMPWSLGRRITGDTEEEMKADAAELMASFKPSKGTKDIDKTPTNDGNKSGKPKGNDMNALLRAAAGRG